MCHVCGGDHEAQYCPLLEHGESDEEQLAWGFAQFHIGDVDVGSVTSLATSLSEVDSSALPSMSV
eukprot:1811533-Heterocapsa_arctica.AAC.1